MVRYATPHPNTAIDRSVLIVSPINTIGTVPRGRYFSRNHWALTPNAVMNPRKIKMAPGTAE
jgi:hypothetical protein